MYLNDVKKNISIPYFQIQVFDDNGRIVKVFQDEYLASVCSLNIFHPTRNVLVGGNSSGRIHVFME